MDKIEIERIKDIFDSIICLSVEGAELFSATKIINSIYKEAEKGLSLCERHLTSTIHPDGEGDAVYCGGCSFTHKPGKCPDGLNARR